MIVRSSLRVQMALTGLAAVSLLALTAILVREVVVGAEARLIEDAERQCLAAAEEMAEQYGERLAFSEDGAETLPREARDLSLRALTATVLRVYDGLEGGFFSPTEAAPLGRAFPTRGGAASALGAAEQELLERLRTRAAADGATSESVEDGASIVAGAAVGGVGFADIAWTLKRLPGAADAAPARRRWLTGGLALSALFGLGGLSSISLQLRRGADVLERGLRRLETDLAHRFAPIDGEFGRVAASINRMADSRDALESSLRRQERLAALGRVVSGVAHEIRNPLNSMRLTLELLERRARAGRAEPGQVEAAIAEADRLDGILARLLAFGRPGIEEEKIQPLAPLIDRAAAMVEEPARRREVEVAVGDVDPNVVAAVEGAQIEQVLLNLLLNGVEACGPGGRVEIRLRDTGRGVEIDVEDDGSGIPDGARERIFDPYFTTKETGNGLGLAISREIARRRGGDLDFDSRPGRTVFTLRLPTAGDKDGER